MLTHKSCTLSRSIFATKNLDFCHPLRTYSKSRQAINQGKVSPGKEIRGESKFLQAVNNPGTSRAENKLAPPFLNKFL